MTEDYETQYIGPIFGFYCSFEEENMESAT